MLIILASGLSLGDLTWTWPGLWNRLDNFLLGNPEADPKAWDWQNEPHNLPVFSPYPFSKVMTIMLMILMMMMYDQVSLETSRPSFLKINRNVSVMVGETAHLPCRVKNLDRYTVSFLVLSILSHYIFKSLYSRSRGFELVTWLFCPWVILPSAQTPGLELSRYKYFVIVSQK